jgi:hypothetical protein
MVVPLFEASRWIAAPTTGSPASYPAGVSGVDLDAAIDEVHQRFLCQ